MAIEPLVKISAKSESVERGPNKRLGDLTWNDPIDNFETYNIVTKPLLIGGEINSGFPSDLCFLSQKILVLSLTLKPVLISFPKGDKACPTSSQVHSKKGY